MTAVETAAAIRARQVSPLEALDACLEAIGRLNGSLNAVCRLDVDEARDQARAMGDGLVREAAEDLPPFLGVPIGIKDLHPVRGWPTCDASEAVVHRTAARDGLAVGVLRAAGFLFACGTTSPELGTVSVTESLRHGATRNPWNLSVSPGGSSGGSAALVAAGCLPVAHGSDGAGSIREPASHCGLVGLKPSRARVPAAYIGGLATEGVLTRTVEDTAAILDLWARAPRHGWYAAPAPDRPYRETVRETPRRLRVGVAVQPLLPTLLEPSAVAVADRCAALLTELGHAVEPIVIPAVDPEWFQPRFETLYCIGTAGLDIHDETRLEPVNQALRAMARRTDALTFVQAQAEIQATSRVMLRAWDQVDVVLTPTNPGRASYVGELWAGQERDPLLPLRRAEATAAFTVLANVLGLPAVSLPLFTQPDGMPLGVQLIGRPWDEETVLALAYELEQARPWHDRHPPRWAPDNHEEHP